MVDGDDDDATVLHIYRYTLRNVHRESKKKHPDSFVVMTLPNVGRLILALWDKIQNTLELNMPPRLKSVATLRCET